MKNKTTIYVAASVVLVISISAGGIFLAARSQNRKAFDTFEIANSEFMIRVNAYRQFAAFALPGVTYVVQSRSLASDRWSDVLTVRGDQAVPIPRQQFRFVSNQTAYFFIESYYVVTTDSGNKWNVWDANKDLPVQELMQEYNLWPAIKEIDLEQTGTGRMTLYQYLTDGKIGPNLMTEDYGRHWNIQK